MSVLQKTQRGLVAALIIVFSALYFISSAGFQIRHDLRHTTDHGRVLAPDLLGRPVDEASITSTAISNDAIFSLNHTIDESTLRNPYTSTNLTIDDVRRFLGTQSSLGKRQEMTAYEICICKGIFMKARVSAGGHASQTNWRTLQQVLDNGWTSKEWQYPAAQFPSNLKVPFQSLGISTRARSNLKYLAENSKSFLNTNEQEKDPTDAQFWSLFNVEAGSLVALYNVGPREAAQDEENSIPPQVLSTLVPKVSRWSDVVWIQWVTIAKDKAKNLKYIWRDAVVTPATKEIMEETVHQQGGLHLPWPGRDFTMADTEGVALLGTVHGLGIGWMLYDHRDLIQKDIAKVKIWNVGTSYCMLWTLKDP